MSALNTLIEAMNDIDPVLESDARAELAQLHERIAELGAAVIEKNAEVFEARQRIAAQERQLDEARGAMLESIGGNTRTGCRCPICKFLFDHPAPSVTPEQFEQTAPVDWREAK